MMLSVSCVLAVIAPKAVNDTVITNQATFEELEGVLNFELFSAVC